MTSTVLLSSIVEEIRDEGGHSVTSFSLMGEPHAAAVVDAVVYDYRRRAERPTLTDDDLRALDGATVTALRTGESRFGAGSIQATQGTIFVTGTGKPALLPKGKRKNGIALATSTMLDLETGYNREGVLRARVDSVRATFPQVEPLTQAHLDALPECAPDPARIGLVVFGTWRGPDDASPGALWCLHSYIPEDKIVEGYLIVRPEHGVSEHGSIYGPELLRWGGRVTNPPALSFAECFDLGDLPYDEALARFVTN